MFSSPSQLSFLTQEIFLAMLSFAQGHQNLSEKDWDQIREIAHYFGHYNDLPAWEQLRLSDSVGKEIS